MSGGETNMTKSIHLILYVLIGISSAYAEPKNPFEEGVEKINLSEREIEEIKSYVVNSRFLLKRSLKKSEGKKLNKQKDTLFNAIREVVLYSHNNKGIDELLIRMILNQGLALTLGVPNANGYGIKFPGLLNDKITDDLLVYILRDHVELAIKYSNDDLKFIESGELVELPFNELAISRIILAKKWISAIFSVEIQNDFYSSLYNHFKSTVLRQENLKQNEVANIIYKLHELESSTFENKYKKNRAYRKFLNESIFDVDTKSNENKITTYWTDHRNSCREGYYRGVHTINEHNNRLVHCLLADSHLSEVYFRTYYKYKCPEGFIKGRRHDTFYFKYDQCINKSYLIEKKPADYLVFIDYECLEGYIRAEPIIKDGFKHVICRRSVNK